MSISSSNDADEVLSEINITPLVDVMLVLLVAFIVTAPLLSNAVTVNLPKTVATHPRRAQEAGDHQRDRGGPRLHRQVGGRGR
jgi:biopolymer transport protein ExbD